MRAILICPDSASTAIFEAAAQGIRNLTVVKHFGAYPASDGFARAVRSWAPEAIFLSLENRDEVSRICAQLDSEFPEVHRVALAPTADPDFFRLALRLKMRELLAQPTERRELARVVDEMESHLDTHPVKITPCDRFYAFMPAKAGVGASTIAAGTGRAIGQLPSVRSLLADFDLNSGILGFLSGVEPEFSLPDALHMSNVLDDQAWGKLIRTVGNTDLLASGAPRVEEQGVKPAEINKLLDYVRRNYDVVTADLPDSFNQLTLAVLNEANHIFLVTTPELPALRMARQKARLLESLDLGPRVSLILNRTHKRMDLTLEEIEKTVGVQIAATFPSDYAGVTNAIRECKCAASLGPALQRFTEKLLSKQIQEVKRESFIERFAVVPLRYSFR